ncbi:MAG TPA: glycosyltransferase family 2 protein [Gemmatimonadaceae bacterium]
MTSLSVVIPARNEAENMARVLEDLNATISTLKGHVVEVIVVDDGSTDDTARIAETMGARVIRNTSRRHGKGVALRLGFDAATGDLLAMMDADYSHRAEELPRFLDAMADSSVGLVIGSRVIGGSEEYTHIRALGNVFLSATLGLCTGRYLSDALNGFKVFRRSIYQEFPFNAANFEIEIEIIANTLRSGYRIIEVLSHERARAGGEAKSRVIRHGTRFLLRILFEGAKGVKPAPGRQRTPDDGPRHPALSQSAEALELPGR